MHLIVNPLSGNLPRCTLLYYFTLSKGGFPVLARSSSLQVHAWALSSNHNAKQLILIRCKHSKRAVRSFVRGLEIRLKSAILGKGVFCVCKNMLYRGITVAVKTFQDHVKLDLVNGKQMFWIYLTIHVYKA